jgi:potassium voltage-gated channel Eag-related subfamily H protein 8
MITLYVVIEGTPTFYTTYIFDDYTADEKMILSLYYALTTLSTVGYGDVVPIHYYEKIFGVAIMILGIAFFSYIMGNFNDVLINYDYKMGILNKDSDL